MPTIAIIQFPGSNCERETAMAVERSGMKAEPVLWNAAPSKLDQFDGYIIVGGFSYEDRSRSGVIAAKQPIMQALKKQADLGKPVLGICNGAQILLEAGLVPDQSALLGALADNLVLHNGVQQHLGFYNDWIYLTTKKSLPNHTFLNKAKPGKAYRIPMANAQGRFVFPPAIAAEIEAAGNGVYFCDEQGVIQTEAPYAPNGSMHGLVAVSNVAGNVMAIMPHPERCLEGQFIFDSMREYIEHGSYHAPKIAAKKPYAWTQAFNQMSTAAGDAYIVQSHIHDNTADTITMLLKQNGIDAEIAHHHYWNIQTSDLEAIQKCLHQSGLFYNDQKESLIPIADYLKHADRDYLLTQSRDAKLRNDIMQRCQKYFHCDQFAAIEEGKVWEIRGSAEARRHALAYLLQENILMNPVEQQACFLHRRNPIAKLASASTDIDPQQLTQKIYEGKVRTMQSADNALLMTTHDRTSAFDRHICDIPHKGMLLNLLNDWWLEQTKMIIPNHKLSCNHPNQMLIKKCTPIPIEVVVRGYICGNTKTSLWTQYQNGVREIDGQVLPEGLHQYDPLPTPIITPTHKAKDHDAPIDAADIIADGLLSEEQWSYIKEKAFALFSFGQMIALSKGFILADTKYEFGFDDAGNTVLIDECHTPDSSRYWLANTYGAGKTPKSVGKDTLRLWLKEYFDPYSDVPCPLIPGALLQQLTQEYYQLYSQLTDDHRLSHNHFNIPAYKQLQQEVQACVA